MTPRTRIKIDMFLLNLVFELVVNGAILTIAYFSNKMLEVLCFYLSWNVMRYAVPKVFHVKHKKPIIAICGCAICSICCYFVAIKFLLPIQMSIFSSVIIGAWINYILYIIADYRDLIIEKEKKVNDIYKMTEDELRAYAQSQGLSEMIVDTLVLRVIHNYRWVDIQKERNYTKDGIRYHKERIRKVLKIKL